ncbi:MAG TPA: response regulator [Gemmatimonadales bacterium]|nr:response regulator [Gemmatimonadales bacterium]
MPDQPRVGIILVVDDQEGVRALLRRELTEHGHTVLEAGDGAEALHLVRRRNGAVDLILCDVVMPQMNGTELATRIGVEFPDVPVILMSAFTPAGVARVGVSETLVPVLQKPFEPTQLAELVQLALEHPVPHRGSPGTL